MFSQTIPYAAAFICIVFAILSTVQAQENCEGACKVQVRCSFLEEVVWATDSKKCFVFRNNCFLINENCQRLDRCEEELTTIKQHECQPLCNRYCPENYAPLCADYNGVKKTFGNECELERHICLQGETYSIFSGGACKGYY